MKSDAVAHTILMLCSWPASGRQWFTIAKRTSELEIDDIREEGQTRGGQKVRERWKDE